MKAILHHAGWIDRIHTTIEIASLLPRVPVLMGLSCTETSMLKEALGDTRVIVCGDAIDTVTEATNVFNYVMSNKVHTLYIITEPGHLQRAVLISKIIYWKRGVTVLGVPAADGGYTSPIRRTIFDVIRSFVFRFTGKVVMF